MRRALKEIEKEINFLLGRMCLFDTKGGKKEGKKKEYPSKKNFHIQEIAAH